MNAPMTPGLRAAIAAGQHLKVKDGTNLDPILRAIEDNNKAVDARLKSIEGSAQKVIEATARLDEMDQKMARRGGVGEASSQPETWGQEFTSAPELKEFAAQTSRPGRLRMEMKTTLTTSPGSAGALVRPTRDDVLMMPRRAVMVRDLLPVIQISTGSVEYPRQTERPAGADTVVEGALKPESAMAFDMVTVASKVIAHWIPASRQILDDEPQLAGIIDTELRYGLALKEDQQLLYGSGTGANLLGMVTSSTAYVAPITVAGATMIDQIALAILQTGLADLPADGIVMHPSDWARMRLLKNTQGDYLLGAPGANVEPRLFGLPVVLTTAMLVDKFLVGNFRAAATIYDRWTARVEVATEHADFFVRNLVAILAEERLALAIKRPAALVYGDFGNVAGCTLPGRVRGPASYPFEDSPVATTDLERLVVSLEANAKKFEREMERARQTTDKSMYALDKRLDSSLSKVEGKLGRIGSSIRTGLAGALAGVSLASLTALSDSFTKIQNQLKVGGLEGDALARTYQSLYEIAQKQGAPLEALATLYGRVSGAQKELNTNSAEMLRFTNAVGLALKVNGTSATESSGALLQLAQALGGGKIQAEEFNSLIDGARPLLQAAAGGIEEAGGSVAKLTALVKDGKVSSEAFFRGVLAGTPILDRLAATTKETSEQGLTRLRNSLISLVGALDESTGASQNAATSLSNFASGVDSIASRVPGAVAELKTLAKAFYDTAQSYANSFGNLPIFENLAKKYADPAAIKRVERSMNREAGKADAPVGSAPEGIDILRKAMQAQAAARGTPAKPAATKPNMFDEYDAMTAKALAPKTISLKDYKVPEEKKEKAGGGGGGGKSSAEKVTDYKRETDAIEKRTRAFDSEREAIGKSALEVAQAEGKFRLMEAAQKAGVPVTQQLTQDVDRLSLAYARAKVALDEAEEKQRSFEGASRQAGAMLSDGFKDAVLEGEKLNVVLDRLLKSIGSKGFDSFFDTLFGKEGPGTNLLKSVFSSFSGGKGFAAGGYTGPGRKNDPRGVVHAGEVVWSQADIRRAGGVGTVEAMRRGARGYAGGGIVGGTLVPMSPGRIAPMGGRARTAAPVNVTTNINAPNSDAAGLARLERIVREQEASLPKRLWEIQRRNSGAMNERLHTRGLISGRQHVSDMDSGSLREDLLAGRSDMVRNTIMTAAYREATAVLEESRGEEAGDFLAGFVEGAAGAFAALSESVGLPPIARQRRRLRVR